MSTSSFQNLVSTNNGFFKSDKQRDFLLDSIKNLGNIYSGEVYGNSYTIEYVCDEQGVTKVVKTTNTGNEEVTWSRKVLGVLSVQDEKTLKKLQRKLNSEVKIRNEYESFDEYEGDYELYMFGVNNLENSIKNLQESIKLITEGV